MSRRLRWAVGVVVLVALAIPAATYAYINWISGDAPAPLTLDTRAEPESEADSPATPGGLSGTWTPDASASRVGYRVNEVLFGQRKAAVGRTSDVTGSMVIYGKTVSNVSLVADMTTVSSDEDRRDAQFQGRIMDTARFPTATFELTSPIALRQSTPRPRR